MRFGDGTILDSKHRSTLSSALLLIDCLIQQCRPRARFIGPPSA